MREYNGYRSWNAWNASLWLNNNELLEVIMRNYVDKGYSKSKIIKILISDMLNEKTPDGAVINALAIETYVNDHLDSQEQRT